MHEFPREEDLQPFVGDMIVQVSLDPHAIQFSFASGRRLISEQRIEHAEADGTVWAYDCQAEAGAPLVLQRLLYRTIKAVEREALRLTFRFEGGAAVSVVSNSGPYESGRIEGPEIGLVIF